MTQNEETKNIKVVIAPQTKILLIGYVLLLIAMIAQVGNGFAPLNVINIIVFLIIATLGLYVLNCTVYGKCNTFAWIMSYFVVGLGILAILLFTSRLLKR